MTGAEQRLWRELRWRRLDGCRFRKQAPIGPYIVDFVCFERKLVIELDGAQHDQRIDQDRLRTEWLNRHNFRVLRFANYRVFEELDSVLESIWIALRQSPHVAEFAKQNEKNPPP